jgi:hypothetical protein
MLKVPKHKFTNSNCNVACALDQEESAYGNKGTVPVEQVSQVSQDNKATTDQVPMVEGLHSGDGKGAPDQAQKIVVSQNHPQMQTSKRNCLQQK